MDTKKKKKSALRFVVFSHCVNSLANTIWTIYERMQSSADHPWVCKMVEKLIVTAHKHKKIELRSNSCIAVTRCTPMHLIWVW